jgi:hypothetical protein
VILYEVNIEVHEDVYVDYRAWLGIHVDEMLALPGFVAAEILEQREPAAPEGTRALTIHYRLIDQAALQRYLAEHAPRMRESGVRRFGGAFKATRRVLAGDAPKGARRI